VQIRYQHLQEIAGLEAQSQSVGPSAAARQYIGKDVDKLKDADKPKRRKDTTKDLSERTRMQKTGIPFLR